VPPVLGAEAIAPPAPGISRQPASPSANDITIDQPVTPQKRNAFQSRGQLLAVGSGRSNSHFLPAAIE